MTDQSNVQAWKLVIHKGNALFKQIKQAYKCSLKTLIDTPEQHTSSELNNETKAVYISRPGLYQLIFSLKLKLADKIHSCCLHGNFREAELFSMEKSGFMPRRSAGHWIMARPLSLLIL